MSSILDQINIQDYFCKLKIKLYHKEWILNEYDKKNVDLLKNLIFKESNSLVLHPGGDLLFICSAIVTSLMLYLKNMNDPENNLLKFIHEGDIVMMDGTRAIFRGVVSGVYGSGEQIKLQYIDGIDYLPLNMSYKITPYEGAAKTLSKMPTKHSSRTNRTKDLIANVFELDPSNLGNILKNSAVVISSKESIYRNLKMIEIHDEKTRHSFSTLFSSAYYSNVEKLDHFAGNYSKREPLIKFVSKTSVAMDLIRSNPNIKTVIINLPEITNQDVGDIERIMNRNSISNVILLNTWNKFTESEHWLNYEKSIDIYAWSEEAFLSNIKISPIRESNKISYIAKEQDIFINNYLEKKFNVTCIESNQDFELGLRKTRDLLSMISKNVKDNNILDEFLNLSYALLILFEKSCFPINYLEQMIEDEKLLILNPISAVKKLSDLKVTILESVLGSSFEPYLNSIVDNLHNLRQSILHKNPKWNALIKTINESRNRKTALIFYKQYYIDVVKKHLGYNGMYSNIKYFCPSSFNTGEFYDEIVFTCLLKHKKIDILNGCYSKNYSFLLYPKEKTMFQWLQRENKKKLIIVDKNNHLVDSDYIEEVQENTDKIEDTSASEITRQINMDQVIEDLIKRQTFIDIENIAASKKVECIRTIVFENGEKAFLTKYYRANILDRENEEVTDVEVSDIKINDELVFVKSNEDNEKDIIEDIIDNLLKFENFRITFEGHFQLSNVWRNSLIEYMNRGQYTEKQIERRLKEFGVNRNFVTISNWVKDKKTVGPNEKEVYRALAHMCGNQQFIEKWELVYNSCNTVRSLQMKLKKYLAKSIINSVVGDSGDTEFEKMIESIVNDRVSLAKIVEVKYIRDERVSLPIYMANKLLD